MGDTRRPETPKEWALEAAEHLRKAQYALNCSDALADGSKDKPYGLTETALNAALLFLMDGDEQAAERVYDILLDSGESVSYAMAWWRRDVMESHRRDNQLFVGDRVSRVNDGTMGEVVALATDGRYRYRFDDGSVVTDVSEYVVLRRSAHETLEI